MSGTTRKSPFRYLVFGTVPIYLAALVLLPLAAIVLEVVRAGVPSVARELLTPEAIAALVNTGLVAGICVVANGLFGVVGALVLVRQRFVGRALLDALVDLPLTVSPVMTGLAFILVFGRDGWLEPLCQLGGFKVTFAFAGLVLATLFVTLPFTLREVANVLEELGTADEEAAATLGASPWQTFRSVTLPNIRKGLSCGLTLTLARALGEFGAVLVVGGAISGKTQTATTYIYASLEERQDGAAFGMALVLALISMGVLGLLEWLRRPRRED